MRLVAQQCFSESFFRNSPTSYLKTPFIKFEIEPEVKYFTKQKMSINTRQRSNTLQSEGEKAKQKIQQKDLRHYQNSYERQGKIC